MKKRKINFIKLAILLFGTTLLLLNCQDNIIENNYSLESVTIKQATTFLNNLNAKKLAKNKGDTHQLELSFDFDNTLFLDISNSNQKLTFIPTKIQDKGTTNYTAIIKINDTIEAAIISVVPNDKTQSNNNGRIYISDLQGHFLNGFTYQNGIITKKLIKSNSNQTYSNKSGPCREDCPFVNCANCWNLDEIVITGGSNNSSSGYNGGELSIDIEDIYLNYDPYGGQRFDTFGVVVPTGSGSKCPEGQIKDSNEDCVFDDQIINLLTGKAKCVFNKLKDLNLFKTTIKKFENSKNYNLILEEGMNCTYSTDDACTDASDLANGNITITFQSLGSNNLSLAASILHEGIHAEIYKYVDEHKKGIDPNNRENVFYYYNQFKAQNALDAGTTYAQHEHMQDKYIIPIAEAIRKLDGNRYPLKDYIGFGWDGLKVYKYDKYIDVNGNIQTISPTDRTKLIDKSSLIAASSSFASDCK